MIAVGIDVSKSKSTVAILDSYGTVLATPFNMAHTQPEMNALVPIHNTLMPLPHTHRSFRDTMRTRLLSSSFLPD